MKGKSIINTVGNTPLIDIDGIKAKLESLNPTGSVKDRMVKHLIEAAERSGELKKGSKIIEVTSGNTGISLAMFSAIKKYKFIAVMPESMSVERRKMMEVFGAKIILTPAEEDMEGALKRYKEIIKRESAWLPNQFDNIENITAHERGLGREVAEQTAGKVDVFVAGTGTGGSLVGVARYLKSINKKVKIVAVEPEESAVLSGDKPGLHKIQGIGEGFIPKILKDNLSIIDEVVRVKSEDAIKTARELSKNKGILVGTSSGANVFAARKLKERYTDVVTVLPDRGERYLSEL